MNDLDELQQTLQWIWQSSWPHAQLGLFSKQTVWVWLTHKLWHICCRAASFQHCVHPVTSTAPMALPITQPGTGLAPSDWWQCAYITVFIFLCLSLLVLHFLSSFCTISSLVRHDYIYIPRSTLGLGMFSIAEAFSGSHCNPDAVSLWPT